MSNTAPPLHPSIEEARAHWSWRGQRRPSFATTPRPGQESVWDFPRPPALVRELRTIVIRWDGIEIARTQNAIRVLETAHPPTYYLPVDDIAMAMLKRTRDTSFCEWKGQAGYWTLVKGAQQLDRVAWGYPQPLRGAECLAQHLAFYAHHLQCSVGGLDVTPQPGGFYGGWVTSDLAGPFKGVPGSAGW